MLLSNIKKILEHGILIVSGDENALRNPKGRDLNTFLVSFQTKYFHFEYNKKEKRDVCFSRSLILNSATNSTGSSTNIILTWS